MSEMKSVNVPPENHIKVLDGGQGWIGLLNHMGDENTVTNSARVSFGKMKSQFDEKDEKLLKYLIQNKHLTPLEHISFTFLVHCPLYVRSQWIRHRCASYNELSRRYTEVDLEFYLPEIYRKQSDSNKQASVVGSVVQENDNVIDMVEKCVNTSLQTYNKMLQKGVCKEQARSILPQNLMTTFWWTVDLRSLINFLVLRDDDHAQLEIRQYAIAIKKLIKPFIPHIVNYYGWTE